MRRGVENLFSLLGFFALACLWYELMNGLNYCFSHLGEAAFVFRPALAVLFMPPCMACPAVVLLVHDRVKQQVFRKFLRRPVPDAWISPAPSGSLRKSAIACAVIFGALSFAIVPVHTRISEAGLVEYPIWPLKARIHAYSEVSCIALQYRYSVPSAHSKGGWSRQRALYVRFRDGTTWTTMDGLAEANATERNQAATYISKRAGIAVRMPALGEAACSAP